MSIEPANKIYGTTPIVKRENIDSSAGKKQKRKKKEPEKRGGKIDIKI